VRVVLVHLAAEGFDKYFFAHRGRSAAALKLRSLSIKRLPSQVGRSLWERRTERLGRSGRVVAQWF
ncbi:MAG: hypothetical protein RR650_13200, partial [Comamonas sp.]